MKSIVLLLALLVCFVNIFSSCEKPKKHIPKVIQLDSLANAIVSKHPNYLQNEIVFDQFSKELEEKVLQNITDYNYIDDFDLSIFTSEKNRHGKGYLIHFYTKNENNGFNFNYDVIFMTENDTLAKSFNHNQTYKLPYCNKISHLSKTQLELIKSNKKSNGFYAYYEPIFKINKFYRETNINVGAILCLQ
jgi:opacity protein-like surface antigen